MPGRPPDGPPAAIQFDRGALFYPYVHVRDDNWLKATLLTFPYLERMVPPGFKVNDLELANAFASRESRLGKSMLDLECAPRTGQMGRLAIDRGRAF